MSGIVVRLAPGERNFPPAENALQVPNGLLAIGADLEPQTLVAAYERGIFPWSDDRNLNLWWCPDPRSVLFTAKMHISHSLRRRLRRDDYRVSVDTAFDRVIDACAETRREGTWISHALQKSFCILHRKGIAHSVEVWEGDTLAGGLYGLALGRYFAGESMFALRPDASKIALAHLCAQLHARGFALIDCQLHSPHLATLGAETIPRQEFLQRLQRARALPGPEDPWHWAEISPETWGSQLPEPV